MHKYIYVWTGSLQYKRSKYELSIILLLQVELLLTFMLLRVAVTKTLMSLLSYRTGIKSRLIYSRLTTYYEGTLMKRSFGSDRWKCTSINSWG